MNRPSSFDGRLVACMIVVLVCALLPTPLANGAAQAAGLATQPATPSAAQTSWKLQAQLSPKGWTASTNGALGASIAVAPNLVVVGAPNVKNGTGAVEVFVYDASAKSWTQTELTDSAGQPQDMFGHSVAIFKGKSANVIMVGAPAKNKFAGAVFEYVQKGTTWTELPFPAPKDNQPGDLFGWQIVPMAASSGSTAQSSSREASLLEGRAYDIAAKVSGAYRQSTEDCAEYFLALILGAGASDRELEYFEEECLPIQFADTQGTSRDVAFRNPESAFQTASVQVNYGRVTFSNPPPDGSFAGDKVVVDSANKVVYLLATGTTYFNQGKPVAAILPMSSASPLWSLLTAPPSLQADLNFTDSDTLYNLVDFASKKPITNAPVAWISVVAPPDETQSTIVVGSPKMGIQLLSFDGKAFTPLTAMTAPARETSFGAAGATCGNMVAVLSNDPKNPANAQIDFFSVSTDNKLHAQGSVAGSGLTATAKSHPEVSTLLTFSVDCSSLYVAGVNPKTKVEEIDVFQQNASQ